jgi:hypothetical protein
MTQPYFWEYVNLQWVHDVLPFWEKTAVGLDAFGRFIVTLVIIKN